MAGRGDRLGIEALLRDHLKRRARTAPPVAVNDPPRTPSSVGFWATVVARAEAALAAGAMHSFECELQFLEDAGVDFVVRRATRFPRGETAAGRGQDAPRLADNPFLDPEPHLVVGPVGDAHLALLNKFSVLREHLLLVTRQFRDQRTLLGERDFAALAECMKEAEVLAFYNGGAEAGASQAHKHLQVVTLPLSPRRSVPMSALLERQPVELPFRHAFTRLEEGDAARPDVVFARYRALLDLAGIEAVRRDGLEWQSRPYSLVVTHEWMLLVPRARDRFGGISINTLAFAGSYFVRDAAQLDAIARAGPMRVLASVAP
jgi:sulfate adenylyltransferase (ADP) / ATP adenylyltransferase